MRYTISIEFDSDCSLEEAEDLAVRAFVQIEDPEDFEHSITDIVLTVTDDRDERIRTLREQGLSFRAIAALVGISHTQVQNIVGAS
jgi:predicted Zn-dependent protease with MMP-like domain